MRHKLNLFKINARFRRKLMAIRWRSFQRQARLQVARRLIHLAFWVSSDASEALEKHFYEGFFELLFGGGALGDYYDGQSVQEVENV